MSDTQYASEADLFPDKLERRYKDVELPVRGDTVRIRSLSAKEVDDYEMVPVARDNRNTIRKRVADASARLIVLCLVDQAGNRLLNKTHVARIGLLWDSADARLLYQECVTFCGVAQADQDVDEQVKNSQTTSSDEPTCDSDAA